MTRVYERPQAGGGTKLLILGASAYPHARQGSVRVPRLPSISSAAKSALDFAGSAIADWQDRFLRPLATVDLLVDTPEAPDGATYAPPGQAPVRLAPPTLANVKAARRAWMSGAVAGDVLLFYCCGHGIFLPERGPTFLTASFGEDPDNPWGDAIALDDLRLALGEHPPRQQWLLFDCCNNTPTEALQAMGARADPLLQSMQGQRQRAEQAHGRLAQVTIASSTPGAQAFGKDGRASRFMEAFLDACRGAGCQQYDNGKWWVDLQGIEAAMSSYHLRIAPLEEEEYFLFPRLTSTDAAEIPRLLGYDEQPSCTLLVRSQPSHRLKQADLTIRNRMTAQIVANQTAGANALVRYRIDVPSYLFYDLEAAFQDGPLQREIFARPPFAQTVFEVR